MAYRASPKAIARSVMGAPRYLRFSAAVIASPWERSASQDWMAMAPLNRVWRSATSVIAYPSGWMRHTARPQRPALIR